MLHKSSALSIVAYLECIGLRSFRRIRQSSRKGFVSAISEFCGSRSNQVQLQTAGVPWPWSVVYAGVKDTLTSRCIMLAGLGNQCHSGAFLGFADGGGAETRPEGPRCEARRAESGVGFLGRGQPAHSPPARGSGGAL